MAQEVLMTTITLPADVEGPLLEEARRQGTTPELLAINALRKLFAPPPAEGTPAAGETLFDLLSDCIGTVSGTTEALSENCGQRFTQGMRDKHERGRL
jgi:hypothetical protein